MNKNIIIGMMLLMTLSIGCVDQSTPIVEETIEEKIELKIMSVTVVQDDTNIKVKNTGNVIIEDMYISVIGISDTNHPSYDLNNRYFKEVIYNIMINGEYIVTTDKNKLVNGLNGKIIHKEYIDILNPNDMYVSKASLPYGYDEYVKIAYTDDFSVYTIY